MRTPPPPGLCARVCCLLCTHAPQGKEKTYSSSCSVCNCCFMYVALLCPRLNPTVCDTAVCCSVAAVLIGILSFRIHVHSARPCRFGRTGLESQRKTDTHSRSEVLHNAPEKTTALSVCPPCNQHQQSIDCIAAAHLFHMRVPRQHQHDVLQVG